VSSSEELLSQMVTFGFQGIKLSLNLTCCQVHAV